MSIMEQIYQKLVILNIFSVITGDKNYVKSKVNGHEDLHLDVMERRPTWVVISLGHYSEKGDELCANPDMQIRVFTNDKKAQALTFFQTSPHLCKKVYPGEKDESEMDSGLNIELNAYLNEWLAKLVDQGYSFIKPVG